MKIIGSPLDFVGLNIYTPDYVRADSSAAGYVIEKRQASFPRMASDWLYIGPEVIYWGVRNVGDIWKPKAIYIRENGGSADDVITGDGRIEHRPGHVVLAGSCGRQSPPVVNHDLIFFCRRLSSGRSS